MAYAQEVADYFLGRDTPDWEVAFTHAVYAHAAIADDEDRVIVANTFAHVPQP